METTTRFTMPLCWRSCSRWLLTGVFSLLAPNWLLAEETAIRIFDTKGELIDEIIVTARKREENVQDVPISVSAFSAETIEATRMQGLTDIAIRTPNFLIGQQGPTAPELTIRGIGSTDRESGSDRSVVVFADEVYIGRTGASTFDLFDLERVEVLRGPQGTLFGRNVVGGAVNLVTAKPSPEFDAKVQATYGRRDLAEVKAMLNGGLSDTLSGRLALSVKSQEELLQDAQLCWGHIQRHESLWCARPTFAHPSDDWSLLFSLDVAEDEVEGRGQQGHPRRR